MLARYSTLVYLQSWMKSFGQQASSPLPPLAMLIVGWFLTFLLEKTRYFPTLFGGIGDTWSSSSVSTTFGRDCRMVELYLKHGWTVTISLGDLWYCWLVSSGQTWPLAITRNFVKFYFYFFACWILSLHFYERVMSSKYFPALFCTWLNVDRRIVSICENGISMFCYSTRRQENWCRSESGWNVTTVLQMMIMLQRTKRRKRLWILIVKTVCTTEGWNQNGKLMLSNAASY